MAERLLLFPERPRSNTPSATPSKVATVPVGFSVVVGVTKTGPAVIVVGGVVDELSEDALLVEDKLVKVRLLLVVCELLVVVVVLERDDPFTEFDGPVSISVPSA